MMAATERTEQAGMSEGEETWLWQQAAKISYHLQCSTVPSAPTSLHQRFSGKGELEQELLRRIALLVGVKAAD